MEAKNTIAILGLEMGDEKTLLNQLANHSRLLIVSTTSNDSASIFDYLTPSSSQEEVELINCPKNGCWEADVIFIWNLEQLGAGLLARLQSVATQKIVVLVNAKQVQSAPPFPHSKIISMKINTTTNVAHLKSDDAEARKEIAQIILQTGLYQIEQDF